MEHVDRNDCEVTETALAVTTGGCFAKERHYVDVKGVELFS